MLNSILSSSSVTANLNTVELLACTGASLVLGMLVAFIYMYKNNYNKNFVITLALLPAIVQLVIMLVNGNVGAGIAVMGAFNLVRFRSVPGTAKDIGSIFCAMAMGLATGMGYVGVAFIFLVCLGLMNIILYVTRFGESGGLQKQVKITIPENLDYSLEFVDLFDKYSTKNELVRTKTTNMGSLFELTYLVDFKRDFNEKEFIDEVRCRNGNLPIVCSHAMTDKDVI